MQEMGRAQTTMEQRLEDERKTAMEVSQSFSYFARDEPEQFCLFVSGNGPNSISGLAGNPLSFRIFVQISGVRLDLRHDILYPPRNQIMRNVKICLTPTGFS